MTNTKLFLLIGTSLSLIPQTINAQCVATQDCATLGYTETSCSSGNGVKCPFGNKWACFKSESEVCQQYGFTFSCTGTGYSGGSGKDCNNKYAECTCINNYKWKDNKCIIWNGAYGNYYYCNGIIVAVKTDKMNFYIALKDAGKDYFYDLSQAISEYRFCNTIQGGRLPTINQLQTIYQNKTELNTLLSENNGIQIYNDKYWSATSGTNCTAGRSCYKFINMENGEVGQMYRLGGYYSGRAILSQ